MRFGRKYLYRGTAVAGAVGLTVALLAGSSFASDAESQADADALRSAGQSTGAVVVVKNGDSIESYGSGSTQSGAQRLPTGDDQFRVASNTKMFVSTVLLQLVEEGKLDLDDSIGDYLPGLVTGEGIDESQITVRQLMQHTSGLADYATLDVLLDPTLQLFPPAPEQLVSLGLRHGSQFEPGTDSTYSNTGYVILGLLVEKLTGQRLGDVLEGRIIDPLDLEETSYAYAGDKTLEGPHFHGYVGVPPLQVDVTGYEPGVWAGAGALVSSGSDLTTFVDALLGGKLLSASMLDEMRTTFADTGYGLGLATAELSCGTAWGHTGHVPGYFSYAFSDGKGRSVFAAVNATPTVANPGEVAGRIIESELCDSNGEIAAKFADGLRAELAHADELNRAADQLPGSAIQKGTAR